MSTGAIIFFAGLMLAGFVASALYSGLETGVYVLNPVRLRLRASGHEGSALRLRRELRHPSRVLAVLLIGTNAANYLGSFGLAELLNGAGLDGWTLIILQIVLFTPLLFVFAESLPKELFRMRSDRWTYRFAAVITGSRWVMTAMLLLPIVNAASNAVSRFAGRSARDVASARARMSQLLKEGVGSGVLSVAQTTLADRVLTLRDQSLRAVMVPWREVWTVPLAAAAEVRTARVAGRHFTRLPVVDERGTVVGIVSWIDALLEPERPTAEIMGTPLVLDPDTRLVEAVATLRHEHRAMAIVQTRNGRPLGLISLKDLVEPLTGELAAW